MRPVLIPDPAPTWPQAVWRNSNKLDLVETQKKKFPMSKATLLKNQF